MDAPLLIISVQRYAINTKKIMRGEEGSQNSRLIMIGTNEES
jgi:hypothetical protein